MKHTKLLALSAAITAVVSVGAQADNHKFEVRAEAGRMFFDEALEDGNTWGLGLGYYINQNWELEVVASQFDSETDVGSVDVDGSQYRVDALYNIDTDSVWRPYVAFGVGDQKREWNTADSTSERDTLLIWVLVLSVA